MDPSRPAFGVLNSTTCGFRRLNSIQILIKAVRSATGEMLLLIGIE
jgi:hypothetical protein